MGLCVCVCVAKDGDARRHSYVCAWQILSWSYGILFELWFHLFGCVTHERLHVMQTYRTSEHLAKTSQNTCRGENASLEIISENLEDFQDIHSLNRKQNEILQVLTYSFMSQTFCLSWCANSIAVSLEKTAGGGTFSSSNLVKAEEESDDWALDWRRDEKYCCTDLTKTKK